MAAEHAAREQVLEALESFCATPLSGIAPSSPRSSSAPRARLASLWLASRETTHPRNKRARKLTRDACTRVTRVHA